MSAFLPLTLVNNAAVNVVFSQTSNKDGIAMWHSSDAVYDAKKVVTMSLALPRQGSTVARIKQKIVIPVMDTVDVTKKVSEAYIFIETVLPKNASETVRMDTNAYARSLLSNAVSTAAFQSLQGVY